MAQGWHEDFEDEAVTPEQFDDFEDDFEDDDEDDGDNDGGTLAAGSAGGGGGKLAGWGWTNSVALEPWWAH